MNKSCIILFLKKKSIFITNNTKWLLKGDNKCLNAISHFFIPQSPTSTTKAGKNVLLTIIIGPLNWLVHCTVLENEVNATKQKAGSSNRTNFLQASVHPSPSISLAFSKAFCTYASITCLKCCQLASVVPYGIITMQDCRLWKQNKSHLTPTSFEVGGSSSSKKFFFFSSLQLYMKLHKWTKLLKNCFSVYLEVWPDMS